MVESLDETETMKLLEDYKKLVLQWDSSYIQLLKILAKAKNTRLKSIKLTIELLESEKIKGL